MPDNQTEAEAKKEAEAKRTAMEIGSGVSAAVKSTFNSIFRTGAAGARAVQGAARSFSGVGILMIFILLFHFFIDVANNFNVWWARALFYGCIVFPWGMLYIKWEEAAALSLIAFLLPFASGQLLSISFIKPLMTIISPVFGFFLTFMPIWFIVLLGASFSQSKSSRVITFAYIFFLIGMLIASGYLSQIGEAAGITPEAIQGMPIATGAANLIRQVPEMPAKVYKTFSGLWQAQVALAAGDYYTGQVEQNKAEPLGVYIENMQQAEPYFYEGDPVMVWATIKAKTIDNEITITPSCSADDGKYLGNVDLGADRKNFTIVSLEEQDIDCKISTLPKGSHTIKISASFNFKTMSYMKTYFMDRNRLRSMLQEGIDPLTQYQITERTPTAIFTNGPVMIGMDLPTPPVGIDVNSLPPTFGITINNRWDGKLSKINKLIIYIPDGFKIDTGAPGVVGDTGDCSNKFDPYTPSEDEVQEGYVAYKLNEKDDAVKHLSEMQDIRGFQTFKCRLGFSDIDKILGNTPIITKYFKATVEYDYTASKIASVQVKEGFVSTERPLLGIQAKKDPAIMLADIEKAGYKEIIEATPGGKAHHELVAAVLSQENPALINTASSSTGCIGLMQFCQGTAVYKGLCNPQGCSKGDYRTDPTLSLQKGSDYLLELKSKFSGKKDMEKFAVASYNGGSELIRQAILKTGNPDPTWEEVSPQITLDLIEGIAGYQSFGWKEKDFVDKIDQIKTYVEIVTNYYLPYYREKGNFK